MSGIRAVASSPDARLPPEARPPPKRDAGDDAPPRRPRPRRVDSEIEETEPHKLNLEA